jgi:regulatory protein
MAIVTKITTQQKNQDRFNVFMDYGKGEEYAFSVDSDVLIRFNLRKGMELDEFSFLEIQFADDIRKAYNLAVHYLARRMRSEKEIRDYLLQKETDEPIVNEVLHKLTAQKYINDEEYAFSYVRTQVNTTDKGPEVVQLELKDRGIAEDVQKKAMMEYPIEIQIEKATKLCHKNAKKNIKDSQRIARQKLEQLLQRKGYPYEVIQAAIKEADTDKEKDDEMAAIRFQGEKVQRKYHQYSGYEYNHKIKQALYRKGFSLELIERYLSEQEES